MIWLQLNFKVTFISKVKGGPCNFSLLNEDNFFELYVFIHDYIENFTLQWITRSHLANNNNFSAIVY